MRIAGPVRLEGSPVQLFAADAAGGQLPLRCEGLMLSLLGTADASTLTDWFSRLAEGGRVVDDLQVGRTAHPMARSSTGTVFTG